MPNITTNHGIPILIRTSAQNAANWYLPECSKSNSNSKYHGSE